MHNDSPSLKDFVYSIPICCTGADLGSLLNIFQQSNCPALAVAPDDYRGWGLIKSGDVLTLLSRSWRGRDSLCVGYPRRSPEKSYVPHFHEEDFAALVKPVSVYQGDLSLNRFLECLEYVPFEDNLPYCLILDCFGDLLGQLDLAKLLQYLAQKSHRPGITTNFLETTAENASQDLIEAIALPCKVETWSGQNICANQLWQRQIAAESELAATESKERTNTQIASWWIRQQAEIYGQNHHPTDNHAAPDAKWEAVPLSVWDSRLQIDPSPPLAFEEPGLEVKQVADQNYVRVPLVFRALQSRELSLFWLVFAAKFPLCVLPSLEPAQSGELTTSATQKLLAAFTHELKSPLTGIVGLAKLLEGQNLGSLNQRQALYVSLIREGGQRMVEIVEDFLRLLAVIQKSDLESEPVNLEILCQQVYRQIFTKAATQDHRFSDLVDESLQLENLQIDLESGADLIIIQKPLFSGVLIHLIKELMTLSSSWSGLKISISNSNGLKKIVLTSRVNTQEPCDCDIGGNKLAMKFGLNLAIAEYLAQMLQGSIISSQEAGQRQLTLLMPMPDSIPGDEGSNNLATLSSNWEPSQKSNYTILCLYPELDILEQQVAEPEIDFQLKSWSDDLEHEGDGLYRIIEADSLEQAHNLARIWQLDVIVLDGSLILQPLEYLSSLRESEYLAALPLVTLDIKTTEAANQIVGLKVFPCLVPPEMRCLGDLIEVINIATGVRS